MFQSTPALWDGRFLCELTHVQDRSIVSIHARPLGRALHVCLLFNPAPDGVSIHARPLGRALRRIATNLELVKDVSIHARPLGRALLGGGYGC
ncbi:protein of unknown function [Trichlorobacter ammonificans]|uniref:Uncharacterized protein n=1 Tax=Trichlorobacter ammonificans TaxID=2916410 RepID=A0ABN8HHL1_9BACT|nr:protein of unknown function [Trichlorobacter ammonificans]